MKGGMAGRRPAPRGDKVYWARFLNLAGSGRNHDGIDLTENDIDTASDSGHNGASRNRDKARHQSVLD
jgi:hypothetical protein